MAAARENVSTEKTYFEAQREILCQEIAVSLENVLQNINKLNRALEGVIAVGNEFSSVEALWSQFENVMMPTADGSRVETEESEERDRPASKG